MSTSRILSKVPSDLANNIGKVLTVGEDNSLLWSIANSEPAFSRANLAFTTATSAGSNTVYLQGALDQTNTNISSANTQLKSYTDGQITDVNSYIQSVYDSSNTKFSSSGGVISGSVEISSSLLITGNLTVTGNVTTVSANNLSIQDNMIYLNANNYVSNPDLGFAGNYYDGTYRHAGFFRDATDGVWKVFDNYLPEPDASPYIDTSNSSFRIASFQANNVTYGGTLTGSTGVLNIGSGQIYKDASGNIGIGTSSPSRKLEVNGYFRVTDGTVNTEIVNGGSVGYIGTQNIYPLAFQVGSAEKMRLDTSGNLGLGVTPSGWGSSGSLDGKNDFTWSSYDGSIGSNYYYNSGYKYKSTGIPVSKYAPYNGTHTWFTAPAGTAGNAISFTQAMTLDASGYLGIGATSVTSGIQLGSPTVNASGTSNTLRIYRGGVAGQYAEINDTGAEFALNSVNGSGGGFGFFNDGVRKITIDSSGIMKIAYQNSFNTTTPGQGLYGIHFNGQLTNDYASGITWNGGYSGTDTAQAGIYVQGSGAYGTKMYFATTESYVAGARTRMLIDYNGNVTIYNSLTESSSIRYKENIVPISNGLEKINNLVGVTYIRKGNDKEEAGLIAEDVYGVLPLLVSKNDDGEIEGVHYTKITAYLIEAVKELTKEIELLKNGRNL